MSIEKYRNHNGAMLHRIVHREQLAGNKMLRLVENTSNDVLPHRRFFIIEIGVHGESTSMKFFSTYVEATQAFNDRIAYLETLKENKEMLTSGKDKLAAIANLSTQHFYLVEVVFNEGYNKRYTYLSPHRPMIDEQLIVKVGSTLKFVTVKSVSPHARRLQEYLVNGAFDNIGAGNMKMIAGTPFEAHRTYEAYGREYMSALQSEYKEQIEQRRRDEFERLRIESIESQIADLQRQLSEYKSRT